MLKLRYETPAAWADLATAHLDKFLQDHASNERKVSQSALTLAVHHPSRIELVDAMVELAQEELQHFAHVYALLKDRGVRLAPDAPDPYMGAVRRLVRKHPADVYLLDRLLVFGVVEARGCERFNLIAEALPTGPIKEFYTHITRSEARHHALFVRLAKLYFDAELVSHRLDVLLCAEADIVRGLPLRAALH